MWAIARKEWAHYFGSITGYFIISFYLLVNSLFLFVLPRFNILDFGYASLQVYFDFAPWFLLFLIPAITMRSFADEQAQGTAEILYSLPISIVQIVLGKLLGVFLIILIAIAPTLVYAFVLDQLSSTGGLDWGATLGAYIGLLLLTTSYAVIGLFSSSKTKQPVVAFVFSILIAAFVFKDFDGLSSLSFVDPLYGYYISQLGMSAHFDNMSRGVVTATDFIYFISVIVLFIFGCKENISQQKQSIFLFVITPRKEKWQLSTLSDTPFVPRLRISPTAAGLSGDELVAATGIKDLDFCHGAAFMAVGKTKESLLELVKLTLKGN